MINSTHFSEHISKIHYLSSQDVDVKSLPENVVKMMVMEHDKTKLQQVWKKAVGIEAEMVYSLPYLLEFTPLGISKAAGLLPLTQALSIDNLPIYTAGDGQNDLALFELARKSFAPSSAHPAVLEKADHIIERDSEGILTPILNLINR
jgi:HAD superfamily hydrolase (TIGR01484 family)